MSKNILFVDDERYYCTPYVEKLQAAGFVVHYCETVAEGLLLLGGTLEFGLVVLDVMMPPPHDAVFDEVLEQGNTGLWFLRETMPTIEARSLPVIVLTNRSVESVREFIGSLKLSRPQLIDVRFKADTSNTMLPTLVSKQIALCQQPGR